MAIKWNIENVSEIFNKENCILISTAYKNMKEKLQFVCSCGNTAEISFDHFVRGHRCNKCGTKKTTEKQTKSHEKFIEQFNKIKNSVDFEIISKYTGALKNIKIKHIKCGTEFETKPSYLLQGTGCPNCKGETIKNSKIANKSTKFEKIFSKYNKDFILLSPYQGTHKKIQIKHVACNNEFETTPSYIYRYGLQCKICENSSKGEFLIRNLLNFTKETFTEQYSFEDCIDKGKLKFDFAIFNHEKLEYLIEFNGIQHYAPVQFGGITKVQAQENFLSQQKRDNIKQEYCLKNDINLIEIKFTDLRKLQMIAKFYLNANIQIYKLSTLLELAKRDIFYCSIPIEIISKSNSLMSTRKGITYVPKRFKDFDSIIKEEVQKEMEKKEFKIITGPLNFYLNNFHATKRVKDVSNSFKSICDALNKVLYVDDNQIISCSASKNYDKFDPRIEILAVKLKEEHELSGKKKKNEPRGRKSKPEAKQKEGVQRVRKSNRTRKKV